VFQKSGLSSEIVGNEVADDLKHLAFVGTELAAGRRALVRLSGYLLLAHFLLGLC